MESLHSNSGVKVSSFSNYRPLLHVIGYANHNEKDALSVIQNGVRGGVISIIRQDDPPQASVAAGGRSSSEINNTSMESLGGDDVRRSSSVDLVNGTYTLLPSSAFISVVSLMVAQGYFCPSLPFTAESGHQAYNYRSEAFPRDAFTVVVLLFPECFVEPKEFIESDFWDDMTSGVGEPCLPRGSSPSLDQRTPSRPGAGGGPMLSASPSTLFTSTSIAINKIISTVSDLPTVLQAREELAVNYLASINNALYQIKMYEMERLSSQVSQPTNMKRQPEPKTKDGAPSTLNSQHTVESSMLRTLSNELERLKIVLLMCLCAASVKVDEQDFPSVAASFLKISKGLFHGSFESQQRPNNAAQHDSWYDECLRQVTESYNQIHQNDDVPRTLEGYLEQIRSRSNLTARGITSARTMVLHRPHDGHDGVCLTPLGFSNRAPVVLPHLPIQKGEVQFIISPQSISLDASANPLSALLHKCTTRRLGPSDIQSERLLQENGWKSLTPQEMMVLNAFAMNAESILKFMEKNPEILSQMILCFSETYEDSVSQTNGATGNPSELKFAAAVVNQALYSTTFTVSVGKFLRELAQQGYFQRETIIKWVEHCCNIFESSSEQIPRSFFALIDFMVALLECDLAPETLQCLSRMRLRKSVIP